MTLRAREKRVPLLVLMLLALSGHAVSVVSAGPASSATSGVTVISAATAATVVPVVSAAPAQDGRELSTPAARYAALVREYRTTGAADQILSATTAFWRDNKPDSATFASLDETLAPAAVLLECSLSWYRLLEGQEDDGLRHLKIAERLIGLRVMRDARAPRVRAARRGWFLFAAWVWTAQRKGELQMAAHLERALDEFPRDVDLLIARGTVSEAAPTLGVKATRPEFLGRVGEMRVTIFSDAAAASFRAALAIDPTRAEARVRLARLLIESGRLDEARRELETAIVGIGRLDDVRRRRERRVEHLAFFLLGAIQARAGSWSAAEREYARAVRVCPAAQVARIAQSHAALMAGDETAAREAVATLARTPIAAPADPCGYGDPWRDYSAGQAWRVPDLLLSLWNEVH
jgi:tetratricopeptide (TPR) repeat protein